ncbi:hypothetical protein [Streptomyces yaizuensis]|uniref:DUF3592 domain-containing protein n=1 Tax=Streptomyces yaizuensis TaxID=2989713 RepID=A0ABQ5NX99_9ACTN|nr:hypothetical protein [Streptomyces sp. YSPA8]GLF94981.1 DUF3592 domain-containing protein [Streptomyces sp. YSPA8]
MARTSLPSVSLRSRKGSVRLESTGLLLELDGVRRRIPLRAVATVRAAASGRSAVTVVLTAPHGADPVTYRVGAPNDASATAFADAVNTRLPARTADEPPVNGSDLVEILADAAPKRRGAWSRPSEWDLVIILLVGVLALPVLAYLAGLVHLIATGEWFRLLIYVLGVKPLLFGGFGLGAGLHALYLRALLRLRGVSVLAQPGKSSSGKLTCRFTDASGAARTVEVDDASLVVDGQVPVVYDPRNLSRAVGRYSLGSWVLRTLGVLLCVPLLGLGLMMVPYQVMRSFL